MLFFIYFRTKIQIAERIFYFVLPTVDPVPADSMSTSTLSPSQAISDEDSSSLSDLSSDSEFGLSPPLNPIGSSSSLLATLPDLPMLTPTHMLPAARGKGKGGKGKGGKGGKAKLKQQIKVVKAKAAVPAIRITSSWLTTGPLFPDEPVIASTSSLTLAPPVRAASRGVAYGEGVNAISTYTPSVAVASTSGGLKVNKPKSGLKVKKGKGKAKSTATGKRKVKKVYPLDHPELAPRKGRPPNEPQPIIYHDVDDEMEGDDEFDKPVVEMGTGGKGKGGKGKGGAGKGGAGKGGAGKVVAAKKVPRKMPKKTIKEEPQASTSLPALPTLLPALPSTLPSLPSLPVVDKKPALINEEASPLASTSALPELSDQGDDEEVIGPDGKKTRGRPPKNGVAPIRARKAPATTTPAVPPIDPKPADPYPVYPEPPSAFTVWAPGTRPKDLSEDPLAKPPYTYASLIAQATSTCVEKKLTLNGIYDSIAERWPFFKDNQNGWQVSHFRFLLFAFFSSEYSLLLIF